MEYGAFALEVRVHGRAVKEYRHGEEIWIEGRKGTEFVLRLENRSNKRVLAVPTIDGLSVMDGKEASFDSNGYVLNPWQHLEIPGWRLDDDKVASFRFNKLDKSYAAQSGTPGNVGIIGCAFFTEKEIETGGILRSRGIGPSRPGVRLHTCDASWVNHDSVTYGSNAAYGSNDIQEECAVMCSAAPSLGTEFGSEMSHRVVTTVFNRPEKPSVEMTIRYGDRDELRQRGVDFDQRPVVAHKPSAFPKEETGCKPPPGWQSGR